jgi:hypothetical protein
MAGARQELAASTDVRLFPACYNKIKAGSLIQGAPARLIVLRAGPGWIRLRARAAQRGSISPYQGDAVIAPG